MIALYDKGLPEEMHGYRRFGTDCRGEVRELRSAVRVVHYYYPLSMLEEEMYKRTSQTGKHRRDGNGNNMLDEIALTGDENFMFDTLCRDAAEEMYRVCAPFMDERRRSFFYGEDGRTVKYVEGAGGEVAVKKYDWVEYYAGAGAADYVLYVALRDATTGSPITDVGTFARVDADVRGSVRYVIDKPEWVRENSVQATDRAMFEALVTHMMWRWFVTAYPAEAGYWMGEFERRRRDVRMSLNSYVRMGVMPRPF